MKAPGQLVWVKWADSSSPEGTWMALSEIESGMAECFSVGWLVRDEPEQIVLAASHGATTPEDMEFSGIMLIPKSAIHEIKKLNISKVSPKI